MVKRSLSKTKVIHFALIDKVRTKKTAGEETRGCFLYSKKLFNNVMLMFAIKNECLIMRTIIAFK